MHLIGRIRWNDVLAELLGDCLVRRQDSKELSRPGAVELDGRVNFKFSKEKFQLSKPVFAHANKEISIVRTDSFLFHQMKGMVTPADFWDNEDDFQQNGFACSLLYKGKLAATAFSSFWCGELFELGIETLPEFRGRGFAQLVCTELIEFCILRGYEPLWACRQSNVGSYKLALKLGFELLTVSPYYRLSK